MGLRREDEAEVWARWEALSNEERIEAMGAMENLDDDELRRQVEEMREEALAAGAQPPSLTGALPVVPDGTAQDVLDWVGEDAQRASAALLAEEARPQPRKTLLARLRALVGG